MNFLETFISTVIVIFSCFRDWGKVNVLFQYLVTNNGSIFFSHYRICFLFATNFVYLYDLWGNKVGYRISSFIRMARLKNWKLTLKFKQHGFFEFYLVCNRFCLKLQRSKSQKLRNAIFWSTLAQVEFFFPFFDQHKNLFSGNFSIQKIPPTS